MEDLSIIALYNKRDEKAIEETSLKYGAYCYAIANSYSLTFRIQRNVSTILG